MQKPYGTWQSPLSATQVAATGRRFADLAIDGADIYWGETRPSEGGRVTIMRRDAKGETEELIAQPFNARTRVHEYGGGAFAVADGTLYFSNFADQRLYRLDRGGAPAALTPEGSYRYADGVIDRRRGRLFCVREDHTAAESEPRNEIVAVSLSDGTASVIANGCDFYSNPRPCPDGRKLCWLEWDHPAMPWDGTRLRVADIDEDGKPAAAVTIAGGSNESICMPQWSPGGLLHFVSDRSGWWNLYRVSDGKIEAIWPKEDEFGQPHWTFGSQMFGFSDEDVVCIHGHPGAWRLSRIAADGSDVRHFELPYAELSNLRIGDGTALLYAASATSPPRLIEVSLATGAAVTLRQPSETALAAEWISHPESITFDTERGKTHAFFYRPHNPEHSAPSDERPPLIVASHGGPTGSTSAALSPQIQFWTTRGFAVLDVNYGGSTGYGRAYRERLDGNWGVAEVADCIDGARFLARRGDVDGERLLIRGASAGGYTTLCALTFHNVFRAGASHYGIGDLEALALHTHKFESRYLDRLVGPYPEAKQLYIARSPIHHAKGLNCAMIFFQGLEDRVVPPEQAEAMVAALRAAGLPVAYVPFEGEQHGFRRAENIQKALEAELYFYGKVLGFTPADDLPPIDIENL